jgi:hypothetical protein
MTKLNPIYKLPHRHALSATYFHHVDMYELSLLIIALQQLLSASVNVI